MKIDTIWVDGDSCPYQIKKLLNNHIATFYPIYWVSNLVSHQKMYNEHLSIIPVANIKEAADDYILHHASKNALILTHDILFAERLLNQNMSVMNFEGKIFHAKEIDALVAQTMLNTALYRGKFKTKKGKKENSPSFHNFEIKILKLLNIENNFDATTAELE